MINIFALVFLIITTIAGICWFFIRANLLLIRYHITRQPNQQHFILFNRLLLKYATNTEYNSTFKLVQNIASFFPLLLLVFIVRSFIFEPFQIPSGSMMPTLIIGDFILVEKFAYGIKNPITNSTLIETSHPKRGDIVVFKYPLNPSLNYVKRIIGLPGDQISYNPVNKHVTVRYNCDERLQCNTDLPIVYNTIEPSNFVLLFHSNSNNQVKKTFLQIDSDEHINNGIRLVQSNESMGKFTHNILTIPGQQDQLNFYYNQPGCSIADWIVPQGQYFVMGDSRDNSSDSRYWGFVPEKNLIGKVKLIWMSFNKQEGQLPTGIRLNRIGHVY